MDNEQKQEFSVLPYYNSPESDDQQLFNYQYQLKNGDAQALALMYQKLYEVAYKNINSRSNKSEHIANMSADERSQKAHDAATYIIEQYLKRPTFTITKSITGYLYFRVQWELYGKNHQYKRDQMLIFTDEMPAQKSGKTKYKYLVKDINTGMTETYESAAELYLHPQFKGLRKKRLAESIRTGRKWKNYIFDLLEVSE